jgi:polyvinyl alcohol dehydrogenase (cytochrome)
MLSGTPLIDRGRMFVPLSSLEIGLVINPFYGCCTTSGGMAAVDTRDGHTLWHRRSIPTLPTVVGHHWLFVEEWAPSGAPVWGPPTLDASSGTVFFGTGQNYSRPTTTTSDSIFAVNAKDGSVRWVHQFHRDDAYNVACDLSAGHPNCPKPLGPDLDFGAPAILAHAHDGRTLLLAGEKSGQVYALDPKDGHIVWTHVPGRGGALGGVHWGMAVNEALGLLYVPVSDVDAGKMSGPGAARAGLCAYDIATGRLVWSHLRTSRCADRSCSPGLSAAIIAGPDLVFAGSLDGKLEAYDARSGKVLWTYDSWRDYAGTVNGVAAHGGAFDAHGPLLAGGQLMVSSGYNSFGEKGGNAFLVFALEGAR